MLNKKTRQDILILLFYSVVFLILTYPLINNLSSGIIANYDSDGPIFLWNVWHLNKAPFSLSTSYILYPNISPLALHTYTQFQSFIIILINTILNNLVLSFNITFLLSSVGGAYFAYKLVDLLIENKPVAVLAGQYFAFQSIWSIYAIFGTQNFLGLWYVPATLFFYELFRQKHKIKYAFICGAMLAVAFINGFYPFLFSITGLAIYSLLINFKNLKQSFSHYWRLLIAGLLSFIILAGWKIILLWRQRSFITDMPQPLLKDIDSIYHADPMNLIRPVQFHPLWGQWHSWFKNVSIENGNAFVGFTFFFIILLFIALKLSKQIKFADKKTFWLFTLAYIIVLTLSFGPYLHIFGYATHLPMPHYFLQKIIPQINNIRFPARWLLLAQIFLSVMTAYLLKAIWQNINHKIQQILFIIISLGLILDVAFLPRNISIIYGPNTQVYQLIAREPNEKTVLHIPLSISSGYFDMGHTSKLPMVYQTIHQKPIIGGHLSRLPMEYKEYYANEPVIKYLLAYENAEPNEADLNPKNILIFKEKFQIGYIVISKDYTNLESASYRILSDYLQNQLGFIAVYEDEYNILLK